MSNTHRKFLEDVFSHYCKGEMDTFFHSLDSQIKWTIHGEHDLAGEYKNVEGIKGFYKRYTEFLKDKPKHRLRHLVVEGDQAAAFLLDEVVGKDGKNYHLGYALFIEVSKGDKKILKIDNFVDTQQVLDIVRAATKKRMAA